MLLRKLALLYEFCQQSIRHCFQFLQQDPIEQSGQIQSQYQKANKDEQQLKQQQLKSGYGDLEDQDIDHHLIEQENPFEKLKPTLNFQNTIPQQQDSNNQRIEKEQIKYDEEMVEIHQNNNWNNHDIDQENEHIEL
ncbi:unnamed protein product [Paramecium sonneborni]|uniref:Uncharacterized protein n=1 Tax=Paramecium sonneborni TaxID=65129 RepID=A0A8S1NRR9_9CILI|nr:unnamed protein product [Paramecium sonneborni]